MTHTGMAQEEKEGIHTCGGKYEMLWTQSCTQVESRVYRALNNDPGSVHKGEGLAALLKI
jgi:hypothetical protein